MSVFVSTAMLANSQGKIFCLESGYFDVKVFSHLELNKRGSALILTLYIYRLWLMTFELLSSDRKLALSVVEFNDV